MKNCQDFGKTKNEDSWCLRRIYIGWNYVPKFRGKLFEDEDLKTTENQRLGPEERQNGPRVFEKCLGHDLASHVPRAFTMCLGHETFFTLIRRGDFLCGPCMKKSGRNCLFLLLFWVKPTLLAQTQAHYKYQSSSFRISRSEPWQFKRKLTL